jgi:hypothetical protein
VSQQEHDPFQTLDLTYDRRMPAANAPRALYAHVEIVYGIDRPMMDYLTRFMTLFSDGRHTALNRAGKQSLIVVPSTPQEMAQRWSDFREGSQVLLKEAEELAYQTNGTPYPDRVSHLGLAFVGIADNSNADRQRAYPLASKRLCMVGARY